MDKHIEELGKPVAWTDAEEMADLNQYSYCTMWSVDKHQPGTDETRKINIYSQEYVDSLLAKLEAAEKEISDWRSIAEAAAQDDADWYKLVDSKNEVIVQLAQGIIKLKDRAEARLLVPDGRKLVPIEPTEGMVIDGFESESWDALISAVLKRKGWPYSCRESAECVTGIYKAMLSAEPVNVGGDNDH
ncbi:hypothetical protein [Yersinia hibernica]|uniref:Uncharacterized protein n=1 Tax=Yersinia enterocolitica LC20 TaxID=1443113 RepID=A0A7U4GG83_YEREN|nr:hypothetical protein [Yersinia hibernica]AHM74535.1 hypothetical protein LC20_03282 [Yersinia hibernica]